MANLQDMRSIDRMRELADQLGFEIGSDPYGHNHNNLAVYANPTHSVYAKNIALTQGTSDELIMFFLGWGKCLEYFKVIGLVDEDKIKAAEADYKASLIMEDFKKLD